MPQEIEINNYAYTSSSGTALVLSFTVNAGEERVLYVCTHSQNSANITSVTYGAQSFTILSANSNVLDETQWWGLLNPAVGTANITVNATSSTGGYSAICLNNVDQTSLNLNPPGVTQINSVSNANEAGWCGDNSTRATYAIMASYANTGLSFTYNTAFDSLPPPAGTDFSTRTVRNPIFTSIFTNGGSDKGIAGLGRIPASDTWKFSLTHNWGGVPPTHAVSYLFINETLTPAPTVGQMIII